MKDTARLIISTECNYSCSYCCNEIPDIKSRFQKIWLKDVDFSKYKNVSLTGGEPFLHKDWFYEVLSKVPSDKDLFIYTNGVLITDEDIDKLLEIKNLKCINVGLHYYGQLWYINERLEELPVRYTILEEKKAVMLSRHARKLQDKNVKIVKLNECDAPNEDWLLLEDFAYN
jgi:organic radical activating enzyme